MKTKRQILEEIASKYNSNNRSVNEFNSCKYRGPNGRECAFAMMVKDEYKIQLGFEEGRRASAVLADLGEKILKEEYSGHYRNFYNACQLLHDDILHWDENGISDRGRNYIENALKLY